MWEPPRLTTLWASMACYRDGVTVPNFLNKDHIYCHLSNLPQVPDENSLTLITEKQERELSSVTDCGRFQGGIFRHISERTQRKYETFQGKQSRGSESNSDTQV
jgi:hypothetical protein